VRAIRQEDAVMTLRYQSVVAAAVGLWMAQPLPARAADTEGKEPGRLGVATGQALPPAATSANQKIADNIADHLRQSDILRRFDISISCQNGTAELRGQVANPAQRDEARRLVQAVPGVQRVHDLLSIAGGPPVAQVQAVAPAPFVEPRPLAPKSGEMPGVAAAPVEPMPIYQASAAPGADSNPPPLPPYAWPTYAPYNNYSRVAYPQLYPYQSWPFIGPMYPFPKIPPGWRSVKLEWQDGYWWYGKTPTGHDWWRIRYW